MERLTYVTENGEVLFHPADLPDDEGMTITQLAENGRYKDLEEIAERLANREQAEEQGLPIRWIPCSEQIPEEPEENPLFEGKCLEVYLVTTKYGSSEQDKVYPFRAFWNGINFTDGMNILDVIAWMPLPKPYRESEE